MIQVCTDQLAGGGWWWSTEKTAAFQNLGSGLLATTSLEERSWHCQPSVVLPRSYASTLHVLLCVAEESFAPVSKEVKLNQQVFGSITSNNLTFCELKPSPCFFFFSEK